MKAIQFQPGFSIENSDVACDVDLPKPEPEGRDVLVEVEAISINPVDTKMRPANGGEPSVLGYDAAGIVVSVGVDASILNVGDEVFYAGDVTRPGTNSQFHLVDERIVAVRPRSLGAGASAALPLTSLTAWESLFERLGIDPGGASAGKSILMIAGAGGVGSVAIQLAKLAGLKVLATASRKESEEWCRSLGADIVLDHSKDLGLQLKDYGFETVDYIANFSTPDEYWEVMGAVIAPQGRIVLLVEPIGDLAIGGPFKTKSVTISWEFMFTRPIFNTLDMAKQHEILKKVAMFIDSSQLKCTVSESLGEITAENLVRGHVQIETGKSIGKLVLEGWPD